jgi:ribosomal protein S27AE
MVEDYYTAAKRRLGDAGQHCPTCGASVWMHANGVAVCSAIGCKTATIIEDDVFMVYYRYNVYAIVRS